MSAIEVEVQKAIVHGLAMHSIISKDGLHGPSCQTGEEYTEVVIRASTIADLTRAAIGAIIEFGGRDYRCYWRIKPDVDLDSLMQGPRVYLRFRITNKPELPQSEAA
jgi:hypothetical protein